MHIKKVAWVFGLIMLLIVIAACEPKTGQVTITGNAVAQISTFSTTGEPLCVEDGKPIIRKFSLSTCPHCSWIKQTYTDVVQEYVAQDKIVAYLWELDKNDDLLVEGKQPIPESEAALHVKFNPKRAIPLFVFGCKYVRVGNGYESENDLEAEEAEFRSVIEKVMKEAEEQGV